jgi:hypothetical protein
MTKKGDHGMQLIQGKGETHIILDASEEEREVLRAIVKASFELAGPVGLSAVDYMAEYRLSDGEADQWIRSVPRSHDSCVVDMDFVQGRQCKTVLSKEAAGHFSLDTRYFERFRGHCVSVLERARELITEGKTSFGADMRAGRSTNGSRAADCRRALSAAT